METEEERESRAAGMAGGTNITQTNKILPAVKIGDLGQEFCFYHMESLHFYGTNELFNNLKFDFAHPIGKARG